MMPGDERAVASGVAAHSMRLAGLVLQGEMLVPPSPIATPLEGACAAPCARPLQAVIVIACDDLGAQRAHLTTLALPRAPLGDEVDADITLAPADTGTCSIRFTQATAPSSSAPTAAKTLRGIDIAALAPQRLAAHLAQIIGVPLTRSASGAPALAFGGTQLRFIVANDAGEGLAAIEWAAPATNPASAT